MSSKRRTAAPSGKSRVAPFQPGVAGGGVILSPTPEDLALEEPGPFVPGFACQAHATVLSYGNAGQRMTQNWTTLLWAEDEAGLYERMAAYRIALSKGDVDDAPRPGIHPVDHDPNWPLASDGQRCSVTFDDILQVARRLPVSEGRVSRSTNWQRHLASSKPAPPASDVSHPLVSPRSGDQP